MIANNEIVFKAVRKYFHLSKRVFLSGNYDTLVGKVKRLKRLLNRSKTNCF